MIYFDTGDLVRRTFLMEEDNDAGLCCCARIIEVPDNHEKNVADNPVLKKFKCLVGEDEFEEIISYNKVMQLTSLVNSGISTDLDATTGIVVLAG
jgi:hypothetical protein